MSSAFQKVIPLTSEDGITFRIKDVSFLRNFHSSKEEKIDAKRESKNRDACQQGFLVGIVNSLGYEVEVNRIYKRGNVTFQMFTINCVRKDKKIVFKPSEFKFEYKLTII